MTTDVRSYLEEGQSAIQAAVDACAQAGGGTVLIPAGEWPTGPIHLKSNIQM